MTSPIKFGQLHVQLNNMQFDRLIDFVIEIGERTANLNEQQFVAKLKYMQLKELWPGRGLDIDRDFPSMEERKFWSRVFFDTSRAVFERQVGSHEHHFWQAQAIHQAFAVGLLFTEAVRQSEPHWSNDSLDSRESDRFYRSSSP